MGWLIIVAIVVIWLVVALFDSRIPGHNIKWPWQACGSADTGMCGRLSRSRA
jgi:hypothetical protein